MVLAQPAVYAVASVYIKPPAYRRPPPKIPTLEELSLSANTVLICFCCGRSRPAELRNSSRLFGPAKWLTSLEKGRPWILMERLSTLPVLSAGDSVLVLRGESLVTPRGKCAPHSRVVVVSDYVCGLEQGKRRQRGTSQSHVDRAVGDVPLQVQRLQARTRRLQHLLAAAKARGSLDVKTSAAVIIPSGHVLGCLSHQVLNALFLWHHGLPVDEKGASKERYCVQNSSLLMSGPCFNFADDVLFYKTLLLFSRELRLRIHAHFPDIWQVMGRE